MKKSVVRKPKEHKPKEEDDDDKSETADKSLIDTSIGMLCLYPILSVLFYSGL